MIIFGSGLVVVDKTWTELKTVISAKNLSHALQYEKTDDSYIIFVIDVSIAYKTQIWIGSVPDAPGWDQIQNDADKADFESSHKPNSNKSLELKTIDGRLRIATEKSDSSSLTIYSHDWTDKTTWYSKSLRIVDEIAADSGDQLTYTLAHSSIIDTYHGLFTGEDFLKDSDGNSYRVSVKVNDVLKNEQNPHAGSGGDYIVNYSLGKIVFLNAQNPAHEIKVTYHYATTSSFTIKPAAGKKLIIDVAEVQFSKDVILTDTVVFQPYGYAGVFAPQLGYPPTTLIPLGNPVKYKSISDYQNDALRAYPVYPAMGGSGWRGMVTDVIIFDWDYLRAKVLYSSYGMEIRISLENDVPFDGYYGTATFYCGTETE